METALWHISISHFNEKARWALDQKGIPHRLRAPLPGMHMAIAAWLTRGRNYTFPVLELDGRRVGDSTEIIRALEEHRPEPALYPADPAERRRALALEDWFDEEVGPYVRRWAYHEILLDPELSAEIVGRITPRAFGVTGRAGQFAARSLIGSRFGTRDDARAERALAKVRNAFDRLEAELGDADYLVGDEFGVADLTAASLLYPVVLPPEAFETVDRMPAPVEEVRAELRERRGYRWIEEMFARHRAPAHRTVSRLDG